MDFLTDQQNFYLFGNNEIDFQTPSEIEDLDVVLYKVNEISFEDKAPRKEALENVLSSMRLDGINFIYLILGDQMGVHFYYGVARNYTKEEPELSIMDIGKYILEPSIKGNFRGSTITEIKGTEKRALLSVMKRQQYYSMLEGVPGCVPDDEDFQGVDRLVDVMSGDSFGFMIIASPVSYNELREIESNLYDIYSKIVPLSKESIQEGSSVNSGETNGSNFTETKSEGTSYSKSSNNSVNISDGETDSMGTTHTKQHGKGTSETEGTSSGSSSSSSSKSTAVSKSGSESNAESKTTGTSHSESKTTGGGESEGRNQSFGESKGTTIQKTRGESSSKSVTVEFVNKKAQDWLKYLDEVIIPRLDYGNGKGVFITVSFLFSNNKACLKKLENTAISLFSGKKGNKIPLKANFLIDTEQNMRLESLKNLQLPCGSFRNGITDNELKAHSALSQFIPSVQQFSIGNWITTNELAMIAGLPKKDVIGLELKEEVEFGLNFKSDIFENNRMEIGKLIQSGNIIDKRVYLDKSNLDKHIFVTGVTGSGKTTTCQNILEGSDKPFLVIEPAKTEYRILREKYSDLLIFTLGKDTVAPFRLNPFEFYPHESITSRVDMIQASIEAAFEMEAAIPQIIERAIYECYEDYGWNIATNQNKYYGVHAFDDGVYAFPTLEDLIEKTEKVVEQQGFDIRLKNDYIGSIKARLQGLLVGAKGFMLNAKRSIDFRELLKRKVVLELEEIRSSSEKSLIMGFVLTNLMEAIKANYMNDLEKVMQKEVVDFEKCRHITLIEEAHRLLSKYTPGDSLNKKQGVETFSDMLAEIRKYGECLMIVDQIPNKLTPEVLKNTNTKIVHRLFAEDDKEAIGNTIVLEKEQKDFLSKLQTGSAVVFTQGFNKAIQVQINQNTDTASNKLISEKELRDAAYTFYAEHYQKGTIIGTQCFEQKPFLREMEVIFELNRNGQLSNIVLQYFAKKKINSEKRDVLQQAIQQLGQVVVERYLLISYYQKKKGSHLTEEDMKDKQSIMKEFIEKYLRNEFSASDFMKFYNAL